MKHPNLKPYIAILAGGVGTRLWPKSTKSMPKQFLNLFSKRTLLQETYARVAVLTDSDRIFVISSEKYKHEILAQLPDMQEENLVIEPEPKSTAAAIGLAALIIAERDPEAVMHIITSDDYVGEVDIFQKVLVTASIIAEQTEDFVLWGVVPTRPAAEYGYIQSGEELQEVNGFPVFRVKGYKEKPTVATAQAYIATGKYFWNTCKFSQRARVMLQGISEHMPELYEGLQRIRQSLGTNAYEKVLSEEFAKLESVPIEYGVMEHVQNAVMIPAPYTWSDVGSWDALYDILHKNDGTNSVVPDEEFHVGYDTHGCLISAGSRLVATIGVRDMIIVDSPQALMICPRDRAQDVKKLLELIKDRGKTDLL